MPSNTKKAKSGSEVGYKKPPRNTQFQPGQSGNPRGRPKGSVNAKTLLAKLLRKPVIITINGKPVKVSMLEAQFEKIFSDSLHGKPSAQKIIMPLLLDLADAEAIPSAEEDRWILERFLERNARKPSS
ncbi:DUF5681 domain-containing protein [Ferrovibrio sp.]|uniref:DUF5681 domain-containing protein n=1 Tax=Ferrovibrio sp. TaxID=1917215 RepID=UPI003D0E2E59